MAGAQQHIVKLVGMINEVPAKIHQADDVMVFCGDSPDGAKDYFIIDNTCEGSPVLITPKGKYPMIYNRSGDYYEPQFPPHGLVIHLILKKITGTLIY